MKLVKSAGNKKTVKLSKSEWQNIGKKAGWMKTAAPNQQYVAKQNSIKAYELRDQILGWVSAMRWESTNLGEGDEDTKNKQYQVVQNLSYGINNAQDMNSKIKAVNDAASGFFELGYNTEGQVCQKIAQGMMGQNIQGISWSHPQPKQQQQMSTGEWMSQNSTPNDLPSGADVQLSDL